MANIRNWFFDKDGFALVGATVNLYDASTTHPNPNSLISSASTDLNGMVTFSSVTDIEKDFKVTYGDDVKWFKGLTRHSVSDLYAGNLVQAAYLQGIGQGSTPGAPGSGIGRLYFKTDGSLYFQYASGGQVKVADYSGATGVLKSSGWGTAGTTDITADAATHVATQAFGTISTASAALVDVSGSSFSFTGSGGVCYAFIELLGLTNASAAVMNLQWVDNGSNLYAILLNETVTAGSVLTKLYVPNLGAITGTHTFKLQWSTSAGTLSAAAGQIHIFEFKR